MFFTALDFLPDQPRDDARSGELQTAQASLALATVQLTWSNRLNRKVAYLPDDLLSAMPGAAVESIRAAFGAAVLVLPDTVRLP
jgi:hypothetical protein